MFMWLLTKIPFLLRFAPVAKFVAGKLPWLYVLVVVVLVGLYWWRGTRIDSLKADLAAATQELSTCQTANGTNQSAIDELLLANEGLASALAVSRDRSREITDNLTVSNTASANRLSGALKELEDLKHESPSCEELASADVGAVCPALVARLRQYAPGSPD